MECPFAILGISFVDATKETVEREWKKLMLKNHPDRNGCTDATAYTQTLTQAKEQAIEYIERRIQIEARKKVIDTYLQRLKPFIMNQLKKKEDQFLPDEELEYLRLKTQGLTHQCRINAETRHAEAHEDLAAYYLMMMEANSQKQKQAKQISDLKEQFKTEKEAAVTQAIEETERRFRQAIEDAEQRKKLAEAALGSDAADVIREQYLRLDAEREKNEAIAKSEERIQEIKAETEQIIAEAKAEAEEKLKEAIEKTEDKIRQAKCEMDIIKQQMEKESMELHAKVAAIELENNSIISQRETLINDKNKALAQMYEAKARADITPIRNYSPPGVVEGSKKRKEREEDAPAEVPKGRKKKEKKEKVEKEQVYYNQVPVTKQEQFERMLDEFVKNDLIPAKEEDKMRFISTDAIRAAFHDRFKIDGISKIHFSRALASAIANETSISNAATQFQRSNSRGYKGIRIRKPRPAKA